MTGQQLKNSILQMAVQGKLVPQDPNDEPASVLLERIRAEKEQLIKEGKIKKEKNPSIIFRGADNLPYEKVGKNEPVCIADEVPFDIPESWEWVRLGNIGDWGSGATPNRTTSEYYNGNIPWLKTGDLNDNYITDIPETITELALAKTSVRLNPIGSVLIAMYGATIGKLGILKIPATTNQACCACVPFTDIYNEFLFYFLMSQKAAFVKRGEGGAQPNISKEKIVSTLMPLPPVAEQKRIVEKIKQLTPYLKKYGSVETTLSNLNLAFPDDLKKSILQYAVQGKLVHQDSADEPASVLLERIRAEKEQLIKEGKIKRDKHESVIFRRDNSYYEKVDGIERCIDDELPFEIPKSWEWTRLSTIAKVLGGKRIPAGRKLTAENTGHVYIRVSDMKDGTVIQNGLLYVPEDIFNSISKYIIKKEDVFITVAGTIGRIGKIPPELDGANLTENADRLVFSSLNQDWMIFLLQSSFIQNQIAEVTTKVGQPKLAIARIEKLLIPLPPLNEQTRIVEQIAVIFSQMKKL